MPTTSCGLLLIPPLAIAMLMSLVGWQRLGWWSLILALPVFVLATLAIHYVPLTLEYLWICWRKCPNCGRRKWSYPFTEGFGL